ncbi:hypothetical protein J0B03_00165 [Alkalibacter rhizosphaerae]|uniref:Uroporphyrinogen decarboxylase (URO-D) domain-containing protein n=1 Tax=Alkalibacter rhizosphaerae TaxID=2815577 RepID=A0A975AIC8_9FIRM|nr:uroporphyrinogen decarboxylase family protein [Alkalibacter rhizosphaerae]QSX08544.1 hypothetical protein J0B03_00165 [Alkalibacter rhizosphaerae]
MSKEQLYNERVEMFKTTVNHKEPIRVPILSTYETWVFSYANSYVKELDENPEKEIEIYSKPYDDIYTDGIYTSGLAFDAKTAKILGSPSHFISEDGQTVQHKEFTPMKVEEYPELIDDPMGYLFNKMLPRKHEKFNQSPDEIYDTLKEVLDHWKVKFDVFGKLGATCKERHGLPILAGSFAYPPLDIIFDYLRGFKGTSLDLRRNQEELLAATHALDEFANDFLGIHPDTKELPDFPYYATMFHIPTFISNKQFEKFMLPTYMGMVDKIHRLGGKMIMFLEGNWEDKYGWLNSLPKDFAIGLIEEDDIFKAKKQIGDNITLAGGMPLELMRLSNKERCIDEAKRIIDTCAPGGGYIFATSRALLSNGDVNVENLKAVNEFVHEYGVYK